MSKALSNGRKNKKHGNTIRNDKPQTLKQYNKEISKALQNANRGSCTTIEQSEKEMQSW